MNKNVWYQKLYQEECTQKLCVHELYYRPTKLLYRESTVCRPVQARRDGGGGGGMPRPVAVSTGLMVLEWV